MNTSAPMSFRRHLCRATGWFFALNVVVLCLIGVFYLPLLPNFHAAPLVTTHGVVIAWLFTIFGFVGQFALFAAVAAVVVCVMNWLIPKRMVSQLFSVLLASGLVAFILIDLLVYHLYHFHFGSIFWHIFRSGAMSQVLEFTSREWLIAAIGLVVIIVIEVLLALFVWRWIDRRKKSGHGFSVGVLLLGSLLMSYGIYMKAATAGSSLSAVKRSNVHLIVMASQIIPYYNQTLGMVLPSRHGVNALATLNDGFFVQNKQLNKPLQYPQSLLKQRHVKKPLNIVIIAIDTWRFDTMNKKITPNIAKFAAKAQQFENHISGGNCTRPGIFSMFYGIPANYWTAMQDQHHGPVLMHTLLKDHYQLGIYASASLHYPDFNDTVFREVPNLQIDTPGNTSSARDATITKEFQDFIKQRDVQRPFFSFLFYDEVHDWCGSAQPYAKPFQPAVKTCDRLALNEHTDPIPYLNRYDNAAHYDDRLVGKVIKALKAKHLLQNTIVMITADHGEEFNDENLGYWGHASAYDRYQIHVPMIVYWPGMAPHRYDYPTSHFDIVPTIMQKVLGVSSPTKQYSVGHSLFNRVARPRYVIGSYIDYAVVTPTRITTFYAGGNYAIENRDGQTIPGASIRSDDLHGALTQLNAYFVQHK